MGRGAVVEIVATTCLILFLELTLIRWWAAEVRVVAYFPNLVLIASFLGLGAGALRAGKKPTLALWPALLLLNVGCAYALSGIAFTAEGESEALFLLYYDLGDHAPTMNTIHFPIGVCFVLVALLFVPLGQRLGDYLELFRSHGRPLLGYALDLLGSLAGVVLFAALSFAGARPWLWFLVALALAAPLLRGMLASRAALATILLVLSLGCVLLSDTSERYSPYYAIDVVEKPDSIQVLTNGSLHQVMYDLRNGSAGRFPPSSIVHKIRAGYHLPYQELERPIRKALVLGAGTGNDVAVLLDEGAQEVHAVEIDPVILALGRARHPAQPYSSERVKVFNMDARTFLNETTERYDVITFGTLDSMTKTSALSTVRLDNFVYTLECVQQARSLLTEDGGLVMFFMAGTKFILRHLYVMLTRVFDATPTVVTEYRHLFNLSFMAGPGFAHLPGPSRDEFPEARDADVPTDDWPYLYLDTPSLDRSSLSLSLLLLLLSAAFLLTASPELRRIASGRRPDLEMFFFGAAFLLMETRLVTAMGLVWGATWLTSAVVFAAFLSMMLGATLLAERRRPRFGLCMAGLLISLGVVFVVDVQWLLASNLAVKLGLSFLYAGVPILFAALCFADRFADRSDVAHALGWNVAGAVVGGLLEAMTSLVGLRNLVLVAVLFYVLVTALYVVHRRSSSVAAS
jgi:spermidine synthase